MVSNHLVPTPLGRNKSPRPVSPAPQAESASDNGSEVSDEGYRSLGVVAGSTQGSPSTKTTNRYSMHSQNSMEDAEYGGKFLELLFQYFTFILFDGGRDEMICYGDRFRLGNSGLVDGWWSWVVSYIVFNSPVLTLTVG